MLLAHGELFRTLPYPVSMTELGIAVTVYPGCARGIPATAVAWLRWVITLIPEWVIRLCQNIQHFHRTVKEEFHEIALRKKVDPELDVLRTDLDVWIAVYNN